MPCACQIPVPDYPSTADWGPILWTILHGLAQRAGRSILPADETREWQKFLKCTGEILPCDHCRDHYHQYSIHHPLTQIKDLSKNVLKLFITNWLWALHNEINASNNKVAYDYTLLNAYDTVNFQDQIWRLDPIMKRAIQLSGVSLLKWTAWLHSYKMLLSLLS
jgi:Erv1 / Alr family